MKTINLKTLLLVGCGVISSVLFAQQKTTPTAHVCSADSPTSAQSQMINEHVQKLRLLKNNTNENEIIIPVVFHVIQNQWNPSTMPSDYVIGKQLETVNKAFNEELDYSFVKHMHRPFIADVNIKFVLATVAPDGSPTTGIERTNLTGMNVVPENISTSTANGGLDPWPSHDYLNIYLVSEGLGVLGRATNPYSPINRVFINTYPNTTFGEGVHILTHEIGHWLFLDHITGVASSASSGQCGDDNIDDTPPQQGLYFICDTTITSNCTGTVTHDMAGNLMGYSGCATYFTEGQKERMRASFAIDGRKETMLWSKGAGNLITPPANRYRPALASTQSFLPKEMLINGSVVSNFENASYSGSGTHWDYTSTTINLTQGSSNTIQFDPKDYGFPLSLGYKCWIDFNQDLDFDDPGEVIFMANPSPNSVSGTFNVPFSALAGTTRMRLAVVENDGSVASLPTNAYSGVSTGLFIDYTVNVISTGGLCIPSAMNANSSLVFSGAFSYLVAATGVPIVSNYTNFAFNSANSFGYFEAAQSLSVSPGDYIGAYLISGYSNYAYTLPDGNFNWAIWVDYNGDDNFFGPNELALSTAKPSPLDYNDYFQIPNNVAPGSIKCRVVKSPLPITSPCAPLIDGMIVEDFTLNVSSTKSLQNGSDRNGQMRIYPNPAKNDINVTHGFDSEINADIRVMDLTGKEVISFKDVQLSPNQVFSIPSNDISNGMYVITINTNFGLSRTERVLVNK